jgi:adenine-specific DNA glycosylase
LRGECRALAEGTQELRPASKRRTRRRTVSYAVLVALNPTGELLMVRRPPNGLLGGLWEFPAVEIGAEDHTAIEAEPLGGVPSVGSSLYKRCRARVADLGVQFASGTDRFTVLPEVRHAFTHLKAVYRPMVVVGVRSREAEGIRSDGAEPSKGAEPLEELESSEELVPEEHAWVLPDQVEHLPLPVAQRKILGLARIALAAPALPVPALPASASTG